jgi:hypothetical protein
LKALSLFEKTSTYSGIYIMFIVNRLQTLYFMLIMPTYLVQPYMIWGIIAIGILSHLNLVMLFKWLGSERSAKGFEGFVELFGSKWIRFFAFIGLIPIGMKIIVITIGYTELVQKFIFPSMDLKVLLGLIVALSAYVVSQGMEKTIRFVTVVFFIAAWIILVFIPVLYLPTAFPYDLFPLIPTDGSDSMWKKLLFLWSSLSGPEYLICLAPWLDLKRKERAFAYIANVISVFEYLFLFVVSLLFFGAAYLKEVQFPVVQIARYFQFPIFERIDVILISMQMFNFVFAIAIFLLCFYGAVRIATGRHQKKKSSTRFGLLILYLTIFTVMLIVVKLMWTDVFRQHVLISVQIWLGAFTYLVIPSLLLIANKRKGIA